MEIASECEKEDNVYLDGAEVVPASLNDQGEESGCDKKRFRETHSSDFFPGDPCGKDLSEPLEVKSHSDSEAVHVSIPRESAYCHAEFRNVWDKRGGFLVCWESMFLR